MIDFPASPSIGQIFTSGGFSWRWDGTRWVAAGAVPTVANPNKFINPFCEIDQAREGASVVLTNSQQYIGDGHMGYAPTSGGAAIGGGRGPGGPPGFQYHLGFTVTTAATSVGAADNLQLYIPIEADELYDTQFGTSSAQPLTVSFWANASLAGTYAFSLRNGASARSYVTSFTITAANTWQFFAFTIPGDIAGTWSTYGNAVGMYAGWCTACGATNQAPALNTWATGNYFGLPGMNNAMMTTLNGTFMIGPHKLELGSQATPILRDSFQAELARAQRYYEKSYPPGTALGTAVSQGNGQGTCIYWSSGATYQSSVVYHKVTKRATPTVTPYSHTGVAGNMSAYYSSAWNSIAANQIMITANSHGYYVSNTSCMAISWDFAADARL